MSFVGRVLDAQEAIGVEHEDRSPVRVRLGRIGPGFGVLADDFDELLDAIFFCAEQQSDVTTSEKAAYGVDPGRPRKAHTDQSLSNAIGVLTLHNSQNQLQRGSGANPSFALSFVPWQQLYHIGTLSPNLAARRSAARRNPAGNRSHATIGVVGW